MNMLRDAFFSHLFHIYFTFLSHFGSKKGPKAAWAARRAWVPEKGGPQGPLARRASRPKRPLGPSWTQHVTKM